MKKINSLKVLCNTEIQNSSLLKGKKLEIEGTYFFPVLFSVWNIEYKSFLRKDRKSRSITGADLVRGGTGLSDHFPEYVEIESDEADIISPTHLQSEQQAASREFIRNYYIHYKRIWSPPVIELAKEEVIYMPYTILINSAGKSERKKYYLLEHSSRNLDLLSNYSHIKDCCLGVLKGGDSL
ncbi:hypothetical protein [Cytobacillus firmus]|uniref:hypothetical protein n=1 Tax=Cytobacillus firmus TaxID=1399 RepID=UPI001C8D195D|nr:hypothetical protein [Cytobacillus firmus]MBX9973602.1 hypothetical protein [Cytobacillus firmus]